jgi:hypothetical protein
MLMEKTLATARFRKICCKLICRDEFQENDQGSKNALELLKESTDYYGGRIGRNDSLAEGTTVHWMNRDEGDRLFHQHILYTERMINKATCMSYITMTAKNALNTKKKLLPSLRFRDSASPS